MLDFTGLTPPFCDPAARTTMREATLVGVAALVACMAAWAPRIALKLDNVAAPCIILDAHTDMDSAIAPQKTLKTVVTICSQF